MSNLATAYELQRVRDRQNRIEADLDRRQGIAATHSEQREMAEFARQHEQLFRDLELVLPEPRGDELPSSYRARRGGRPWQQQAPAQRVPRMRRISVGRNPVSKLVGATSPSRRPIRTTWLRSRRISTTPTDRSICARPRHSGARARTPIGVA